MRPKLATRDQMTVEEYLAFTGTRPDEERWELIEGVPVLNASPTDYHQIIVTNIVFALVFAQRRMNATWIPLIGTGTRVPISPNSLPQPDVMIKEAAPTGTPISDEAVVLFEIISKSNTKADQAWRRRVYASIPNCQHYVTVSQASASVTRFDRVASWDDTDFKSLADVLDLPAVGVTLPLAEIYRGTPLAAGNGNP